MGWSCTQEVSETLQRISDSMYAQSGSQNVWVVGGREFFFEISRREYANGQATGSVYEMYTDPTGCRRAHRIGTLAIGPNGRIRKFPHLPNKWK